MDKKFSQIDERGARSRKSDKGFVVDNYRLPDDDGGHKEIHHGGKTYVSSGKTGTDIRHRNAPAHHYAAKEKINDKKSKYHGQEVEKGIWVNKLGRVIEEDMQKFSEIVEQSSGDHYATIKQSLKDGGFRISDNIRSSSFNKHSRVYRNSQHASKKHADAFAADVLDHAERHGFGDHVETRSHTFTHGRMGRVHEVETRIKAPTPQKVQESKDEVHLAPHGDKGTHYRVVRGVHTLKPGEILHDSEVDDLHDMGYKVKHLKG